MGNGSMATDLWFLLSGYLTTGGRYPGLESCCAQLSGYWVLVHYWISVEGWCCLLRLGYLDSE